MHIEIWHGAQQRVGHLGQAQAHFNLMGRIESAAAIKRLCYRLNEGPVVELGIGSAPNGFGDGRRLARSGHFNADIPVDHLRDGANRIDVTATDCNDQTASASATVEKCIGSCSLPYAIDWSSTDNPQDVGQFVDGHWAVGPAGLRTQHTGYERLFLLGNDTWENYQITVPVTIHAVDPLLGPYSGDNALGIVLRFAGHERAGGAADQPPWGYRPFGAMAWLRWKDGPDMPPQKQFYRGEGGERNNFGECPIVEGRTYVFRAACRSLGADTSQYSCAVWPVESEAPSAWDWQVETDEPAPVRGGIALIAHHVNASFGQVDIEPLD
jgi:hypothetical protein